MIIGDSTDTVFISALLKDRYPELYTSIASILKEENIKLIELEHTKDIWCRDYMPVQVSADRFVQFKYDPDYLKSKKYRHLRSEQSDVLAPLGFNLQISDLIVDGGNIVRSESKVIMTNKIFTENKNRSKPDIIQEILTILALEEIIIVPKVPYDFTGHSDGMVRFVNNNTVLLNDFRKCHPAYFEKLKKSLTGNGLNIVLLPWYGWKNDCDDEDTGDYINFLHVGNLIILPEFDPVTDAEAKAIIRHSYPGSKLAAVDGRLIAKEGGLLNCCTWNIKTQQN